jgi:hypothetical protein
MSFWESISDASERVSRRLDPSLDQDDLFQRVHCFLWGLILGGIGLLCWYVLAMDPGTHPDPTDDGAAFTAFLMAIICTWEGYRLLLRCAQSVRSPKAQFTDRWLSMHGAGGLGGAVEGVPLLVAKLLTLLLRLFGVRGQPFDDAAADEDPDAAPDGSAGAARHAKQSPAKQLPAKSLPDKSLPDMSLLDESLPDKSPGGAAGAMFVGRTSLRRRDRLKPG